MPKPDIPILRGDSKGSDRPLLMTDAIGPFFQDTSPRRINWSKAPFHQLDRADGTLDAQRMEAVVRDFAVFAERAAGEGFNALSIDNVAHLALRPEYSAPLRRKIEEYRRHYARMFEGASRLGLRLFLTTDIMFYATELWPRRGNHTTDIAFLRDALSQLFDLFPALGGIIVRIGECDGQDVRGDFRSELTIRTAAQARRYLRELLPLFELRGKLLIFRTWTVGAYRIGDLMWNRNTFDQVFKDIDSSSLVISLKHGETDFFRYLPLNKLFFRGPHRKIVEIQARREYEGFGEYPSFIGWDCENYARQLSAATNLIGAWIWCQSGGWTCFRRRTYLKDSSIWNEINTFVALRIFGRGATTEEAVREFAVRRQVPDRERLLTLLRLSDEVIKELLYIDEFALRKIFFRRLRVPPLLSVYGNFVIVNHSMRKLLRCFVTDGEQKILQGYTALEKILAMRRIAEELQLPAKGFDLQYDTFELLAAAREYYFRPYHPDTVARLEDLKRRYKTRYVRRYAIKLNFTPFPLPLSRFRLLLKLFLRHQRGYRLVDRVFSIGLLSVAAPMLRLRASRLLPDFASKHAMGIRTVLK